MKSTSMTANGKKKSVLTECDSYATSLHAIAPAKSHAEMIMRLAITAIEAQADIINKMANEAEPSEEICQELSVLSDEVHQTAMLILGYLSNGN
jgi:hypothetical protein